MTRIAFLVTHLSGSGHYVRTLALARAARAAGASVRVISGGRALPHIPADDLDIVALPPLLVAGRNFARPLTAHGAPADAAYMARRAQAAAEAVHSAAPHILVTETFPLGRRRLAAEFEAAIAAGRAARADLRLVCSVRDVPEPPSRPMPIREPAPQRGPDRAPERLAEGATERLAEAAHRLAGYDMILQHGDAALTPLADTWPLPPGHPPVHATGYVAAPPAAGAVPADEILVATGGGDLGRRLLAMAAEAAAMAPRPPDAHSHDARPPTADPP
ncbi:MAG: hypothetical protein AAF677_16320, partial [Pseudomonadota bacterium]